MDEPVLYAMILYTDTAMFLNITGSAAALTEIISSTVSYWKGASHPIRLALGSYLLLSRERARVKAIARRELLRSSFSVSVGLWACSFAASSHIAINSLLSQSVGH